MTTELKTSVISLTEQMAVVSKENKTMNETILDLQSRSMWDNLIFFSGIPEQPSGAVPDPERAVKACSTTNT